MEEGKGNGRRERRWKKEKEMEEGKGDGRRERKWKKGKEWKWKKRKRRKDISSRFSYQNWAV